MIHFTKDGLDKALAQKGLLMVDFWADWCGPCKMLAPLVENLDKEYEGRVTVGKVNVDDEQELAIRYGVMSIPTVIFFKDGKGQGDRPQGGRYASPGIHSSAGRERIKAEKIPFCRKNEVPPKS